MPRRLKIVNDVTFMHRLLAVTWVWSVGEGLGFMWSTGIGHHKNTHRNRRSDWLVVKRRDCHYQVILEKKITFLCQVYAKKQVWYSSLDYSVKNSTGSPSSPLAYTWWKRSMSIFASACQELSSENSKRFERVYMQKTIHTRHRATMLLTKEIATTPVMFSWNITLVPLRKFFPIIKTSSPPFTEQLWRLFLRISGTPAGWAEE